jgi:hypothetical protein
MKRFVNEIVSELFSSSIYIIVVKFWIIHYRFIVTACIKAEPSWLGVMVVVYVGKDRSIFSRVLFRRPDHLQGSVFLSLLEILIVNSSKEKGVEAHLVENLSLSIAVSKWINMPANMWFYTEFVVEE